MILQSQFNWYKRLLYLLILSILWLIFLSGWYIIRWKMFETDVNKKKLEINDLQKSISNEKSNTDYKLYKVWELVYSRENKVNYVALYDYLNQVKNYILKDIKDFTISRFILSIKPKEIDLDTTLPSYNIIYQSWWLIDLLSKRDFIDKININNFRNMYNWINVKFNIKTK